MKSLLPLRLDLRALILFFVLLSVLATFCNSLIVAYRVQRDALIHSTLESNSAYAAKVASSIEAFIQSTQGRLQYSSAVLADRWHEPEVLRAEANRLKRQDAELNGVAIIDAYGRVLQTAPEVLRTENAMLDSENMQRALSQRSPLVSAAYTSASGHLVIFISQPIISASGQFLGLIGGSVYLMQTGALHTVISRHFHHEGTSVFVTDANRRLLYHPDPKMIGEIIGPDPLMTAALRGETGALVVPNEKEGRLLAAYAQVADAHWTVVAIQPEERALAPLAPLMEHIIMGMVPAGIVGLGFILVVTALIARPLRQLSIAATQLTASETETRLLHINAWYRDASAIRRALLSGVQLMQQKLGRLRHEAQSDPLTGLANRRAMVELLDLLTQAGQPYAVLSLDIDHFKRVNDTFGHDMGDVALKQVAGVLRDNSRANDLTCRVGGEEFVLVMPDTSKATAEVIAERIRENVACTDVPAVGKLTLSIGTACQEEAPTSEAVLKLADDRLYAAKQSGRNRVVAT